MTDFAKFPLAAGPQWKSGFPTVATSGITFLLGKQWKQWEGALVVATLKDTRLRVQFYTDSGSSGREAPGPVQPHLRAAAHGGGGPGRLPLRHDVQRANDQIIKACPS